MSRYIFFAYSRLFWSEMRGLVGNVPNSAVLFMVVFGIALIQTPNVRADLQRHPVSTLSCKTTHTSE